MTNQQLEAPTPLPLKDRVSFLHLERGYVDVVDGAFVMSDHAGVRIPLPVAGVTCLMLEPGIRISHRAVALAANVGCLLLWVGEAGVRLYSAGSPGGARADTLLRQARLALDEDLRAQVARRMYHVRFQEPPPERRSVDQLRGIEGSRIRKTYQILAREYEVKWEGRDYDQDNWDSSDVINKCLSSSTACLYGIVEAAVLALGCSPAIGFIHTGKPLSFVYDIADLVKFVTVVPIAFRIARDAPGNPDRETRLACRDMFRKTGLLERIVPLIQNVMDLDAEPLLNIST